jgi:hypothetical protein
VFGCAQAALSGGDDNDRLFGDDGWVDRDPLNDDSAPGGADTLFGGAGNDDLIGGSALAGANDANGQPADEQQPRGDRPFGEAGADLLAGDNAQITRPGGVTTYDGSPVRELTLFDLGSGDMDALPGRSTARDAGATISIVTAWCAR